MSFDFCWLTSLDVATGLKIVELYNDAIKSTTVIGYTKALDEIEGQKLIGCLVEALEKKSIELFAIFSGTDVVGMAILTSTDMHNCKHIANLSKGIVHSQYQKSGLLRRAFLEIANYCEGKGYELLTLDVRENSVPHKIWTGLGFKEYGVLQDYARVDGVSCSGAFLYQSTQDLKATLSQTSSPSEMMSKERFAEKLREELESRITMTHPLVKTLLNKTPQWDLLRYMTLQGYQLTKNFLEYIEYLYHHCPRGEHKKRLLYNMFEEETGRFSKTKNHVVLMQDFIRGIGISDEVREAAIALPHTKKLINYRMNLVRNPATFHLGASAVMIASEGQNLETAAGEARHELLQKVYGLQESDLLFFSVHQKEDIGHVKEGISVVVDVCENARMQHQALDVVRTTCDLFYGMYEGVAEVFGIRR